MKYLLTQEEMDNLIPLQKHQEIRNSLLDTIDRANEFIMKKMDYYCTAPKPGEPVLYYCDNCPIGILGSNSCIILLFIQCMKKTEYTISKNTIYGRVELNENKGIQ